MSNVQNAKDEVLAAVAQMRAENDRRLAEVEKKGYASAETEQKVERLNARITEMQAQLDETQKRASRVPAGVGAEGERGEAKRAHREGFNAFIRKGIDAGLGELAIQAALQTAVDADGGYAIPEELERTIGTMERQLSPMEGEVTSITAGAETYEKLMADGMAASGWGGETTAPAETATPTLAQFKPTYGWLQAEPRATQKMLDDAFFDIEAWLGEEVGQKFAQDLDAAIISGDGANKPKGILAYTLAATGDAARAYGTIEKLHTGTAGTFSADNIIDLIHKLRAGYRIGAKWVMAGTTVAAVRKLKDSTNNYLWQPGLLEGQQSRLLGYPIIEDDNMPVVAASANAIAFGNFKRAYKLVNLRGVRTLRDPYTAKPYTKLYVTRRVGGGVEDTRAVKVLQLAV